MNSVITKPQIRFFEYPQVFISLHPFEGTKKFFKRHISKACPKILDMIKDLDIAIEECQKPQTVKVQRLCYITGDTLEHNTSNVLDAINKNKIIRPCKISTVARILLAELTDLPDFIKTSTCLTLLPRNVSIGSFHFNFKNRTADHNVMYDEIIPYHTTLIMETDPV